MLSTGADGDLLGLIGKAVFLVELRRDRLLEFRNARRGGVLSLAFVEGGLGGFLDKGRGVKVRLTSAEADDIDAGLLQCGGLGADGQGDRLGNQFHTLRDGEHGNSEKPEGRL